MKNLKSKMTIVLCIMFMFALGVFALSVNFDVTSFAITADEISSSVLTGASFTFSGEGENLNFEDDYNANNYTLTLNNIEAGATYKWYFNKEESYEELTGETNNSISIRNCNQSGKYICLVNVGGIEARTEEVNIKINPAKINFENFVAQSKTYDGTSEIKIAETHNGVLNNSAGEQDDLIISVIGHTQSAKALKQQVVKISKEDIVFSGEDANNYEVGTLPDKTLLVDINKKPLNLVWETTDNKKEFSYNGLDRTKDITCYYLNVNGDTIYLLSTMKGFNYNFNKNYYGEFINSGNYTATAILTAEEENYEISNPILDGLSITRISPIVTIENPIFTYNTQLQDAKNCVTINNTEQTLVITNSTFTTVLEGNGKKVKVKAEGTLNYAPYDDEFTITVQKATSIIDVTKVKKNYVYTGAEQVVNSGATINNTEQILTYSTNNKFTNVVDGNGRIITVVAEETDNYNKVTAEFTITVDKKTIDVSNWKWNYTKPYTYSKGNAREVFVTGFEESEVIPVYEGDSIEEGFLKNVDAGSYEAKVRFELVDKNNYYPVGDFPSLLWKINKQTVTMPISENISTTFNGQNQSLDIATSQLYTIYGNLQKNAGNYIVTVELNDPKNLKWNSNKESNDLIINWTINKLKVATPSFNLDNYDGTEGSIEINENSPYHIIYSDEKFILLGLNDDGNYAWEDTTRAYLRIDLGGGFFDGPALPIVAITLTLVTLILICVYFAVHSAIILKRHRKKVALLKARKLKRQITLSTSENLANGTNFTIVYEEPKEKDVGKVKEEKVVTEKIVENKNEKIEEDEAKVEIKPNNKINKSITTAENLYLENEKDKKVAEPKIRKPYAKSRKKENKKKVALKKRESNAKKVALKKEAEKRKAIAKKEKAKSNNSKTTIKAKSTSKPKSAQVK